MEPVRVQCMHGESFILEHEKDYIEINDLSVWHDLNKEQLKEFIRLLQIRLDKIS